MKIYIVRHGQVAHNALRQYNTTDEYLTDLGIMQAEELSNKIIYDDRITVRNCGNLVGAPLETIDREEYWNYNTKIKYGTSEDIRLFFKRVYNFLDELKTKDYENVLIVAHSGVFRAFSGYFEGIKDGKFLNRGLKNSEIKEFEL